ncbi:methyl-accepting chemotaxis protein [Terasakiella sp.]|uniref:methyl-accepting chemotaxis protein n=1 Tax=Terasakiella sp. TaxID=2034861 RepID=UPI003AA7B323
MWDRLSLGGKMAALSSLIVSFCLIVGITIATNQASKATLDLALADAADIGRTQSANVKLQLDSAMLVAKELQKTFMAMRRSGVDNRSAYDAVLEDTMKQHPEIAGAWAGFEPNAFDGRDGDYQGKEPHNVKTGRYVTYFYNFGGGVTPYYLTSLDVDPSDPTGDYYNIPFQTGKPFVVDPVMYNIDGVDILLPSFVYPVKDGEGKVLGVIGVDMAVNDMAAEFAKLQPMGTGRVSVISNKMKWVAHPDKAKVGKDLDDKDAKQVAAVKKMTGTDVVIEEIGSAHHLFLPIPIMDVKTPWYIEVEIPTETLTASADKIALNMIVIAVVLVIVLCVSLLFLGQLIIRKPLQNSVGIIHELKNGNFEVTVTGRRRKDEIGEINTALEVFRDDAKKMQEMEGAQQRALREASQQRAEERAKMAADLEETLGKTIALINAAATRIKNDSEEMSDTSDQSMEQAVLVAASAEESSSNAHAVASAAEELSASINEISSQVQLSSSTTQEAVDESKRANEMVLRLSTAAEKIGEVVSLITDIAAQTNLLALNATIEAARAGDAGKGFAVVATEVKNLANQTALATDEISQQVASIQTETRGTAVAIQTVSSTVLNVNEIAATIASAVEEQGAATQEISHNVQQAAAGAAEVTQTISMVREGAMRTGEQAKDLQVSISDMSNAIAGLDGEVRSFLETVRNAGTEE